MRFVAKLLCLGLFIAFVSCSGSGSTVPVVRDYTNGNPTHNVHPQSVIGRCPPDEPNCVGGGGGGGGTIYGTQGDCGTGYLYFSDGCEDDGTNVALYPDWQNWPQIPIQINLIYMKFNDDHYWNQHLACYLTPSTNTQFDNAVETDFKTYHWQTASDPPVGAPSVEFNFTYTVNGKAFYPAYRIFHRGNVTVGSSTYDYYIVGTAFIKYAKNCPGY